MTTATETRIRQYYTTSQPIGTVEYVMDGEKISGHVFEIDVQHLESGADDFLGITNPRPYREFDIVDITTPKSCEGWRDITNPPKYKIHSGFEHYAHYQSWYSDNEELYEPVDKDCIIQGIDQDWTYEKLEILKTDVPLNYAGFSPEG